MNGDRIERLFAAVADRPPDQRDAYLELACGGDGALRSEVKALLRAEEQAEGFLSQLVRESPAEVGGFAGRALAPGRIIGDYKLQSKIGEGGMSTVYLAARADDRYRKRVAIKLVPLALASADHLRRFRTERHILASLDHPSIARLYDAGTTEEGLPYFVMEYVEGEPIDAYCDRHRLAIRERLELFRTVCSAVHYAHQNLVVHRDLKPSNILVTEEGVPKLLDFGIAKLLNPELASPSLQPTLTWHRILTPSYASPEQIQGKTITTTSDVYSLGVLLYQLLTGRPPYRLCTGDPREIEDLVSTTEPRRPSSVVTSDPSGETQTAAAETVGDAAAIARARHAAPRRLVSQLAGDLDTIALMALRKEPQRRYDSAAQLSEDLRRHLVGLPVIARRDTLAYRVDKFVRRHTLGIATVALVLGLILSSAVMIAAQAKRIVAERDQAQAERDSKTQILDVVRSLLEASDPWRASSRTPSIFEVLDRGAQEVDKLKDQPLVQASLLDTLGGIYASWGRYDEAESFVRRSLEARRRLTGDDSAEVAASLDSLGTLLWYRGDRARAAGLLRRALSARIASLGPEHLDVAETTVNLATVLRDLGQHREAEALDRQALALRRRLLGEDHPAVDQSLGNLVGALLYKGDLMGAEELSIKVIELRGRAYPPNHPLLAAAIHNHASILKRQQRYREAEQIQRQAIAIWEVSLGSDHYRVASAKANLAAILMEQGRDDEAAVLFLEAREGVGRAAGPGHWRSADCLVGLGRIDLRRGQPVAAERSLRAALAIYREGLQGDQAARVASAEGWLGESLIHQRRFGEARSVFEASFHQIRRSAGDRSSMARDARDRLERLVCDPGAAPDAERCQEMRALAAATRAAES